MFSSNDDDELIKRVEKTNSTKSLLTLLTIFAIVSLKSNRHCLYDKQKVLNDGFFFFFI